MTPVYREGELFKLLRLTNNEGKVLKSLKLGVLPEHTFFRPQNNTQKGVCKYTPFHVLPKHTLSSYLNTPSCVPKTHLILCFGFVLNLTHFQVCSAE